MIFVRGQSTEGGKDGTTNCFWQHFDPKHSFVSLKRAWSLRKRQLFAGSPLGRLGRGQLVFVSLGRETLLVFGLGFFLDLCAQNKTKSLASRWKLFVIMRYIDR